MKEKKESDYLEKAKHLPIRLYTPSEVATLLRCSPTYIYKLCCLGVLTPIKARCLKGKQQKFTRSFFSDEDIKKAYKYRFGFDEQALKQLQKGKR